MSGPPRKPCLLPRCNDVFATTRSFGIRAGRAAVVLSGCRPPFGILCLAGKERIESEVRQHLERVKSRADARKAAGCYSDCLGPIPGAEGSRTDRGADGPETPAFRYPGRADGRYLVESHVVSLARREPHFTYSRMQAQSSQRPALAIGGVTYERERRLGREKLLASSEGHRSSISICGFRCYRSSREEEEARAVTAVLDVAQCCLE
jgi:hypothetical protein